MLALVIGIVAAYIAFRQYRVARAKLKLDLFEKRFIIFHQTWVILFETVRSGTREKNYGLGTPFNNFLPEAAFLFGKDVENYLNNATKKWTELHALEAESNGVGVDRVANTAKASEHDEVEREVRAVQHQRECGRGVEVAVDRVCLHPSEDFEVEQDL